MVFIVRLRTFSQKSNIFCMQSLGGILILRKIIFCFCVNDRVLEEGLIFVGKGWMGGFEACITQNILFLHDFE